MLKQSPRSTVKQASARASYCKKDLYPLIDDLKMAHISFIEDGLPMVIPMLCWRVEDAIYIHGSRGSRLMTYLPEQPCAVSFAELTGWVMAKSAFHHSANYRSAVLFGRFDTVKDTAIHAGIYKAFVDQLESGRWDKIRLPNKKELKATTLLTMKIDEGAVKIRTGGPNDDARDADLPAWVGELPLMKYWGEKIVY